MKTGFNLFVFFLLIINIQSCDRHDGTCTEDCHTIEGVIYDYVTALPINDLEVDFDCIGDNQIGQLISPLRSRVSTDDNGFFSISIPDSAFLGNYLGEFSFVGLYNGLGTYEYNKPKEIDLIDSEIGSVVEVEDFGIYHFSKTRLLLTSETEQTIYNVSIEMYVSEENSPTGVEEIVNHAITAELKLTESPFLLSKYAFSDLNNRLSLKFKRSPGDAFEYEIQELEVIRNMDNEVHFVIP